MNEYRIARLRWRTRVCRHLFDHYGGRCAICHRPFEQHTRDPGWITIDHICPKARGGSDELENLRPLCRRCHHEINRYDQCVGALLIAWSLID
jgi:5-methylcytosine-specific restriction endonuclease McrA